MDFTTMDRSAFSVGTLADEPDDVAFWLSQKPEDRLAGIEFLRRQFYGDMTCEAKMEPYFEVADFKRD
jgi:hypothetical protein